MNNNIDAHKWKSGESGNPAGKPKGKKNLSTVIRELLEDERFLNKLRKNNLTSIEVGDNPVSAIVGVGIVKALEGDIRWADWLAKYGFGNKLPLYEPDNIPTEVIVQFIGEYDERDKDNQSIDYQQSS